MIPAFESRYPGKQALFLFDHSTGHHALPADALLASKLNLSDGGAAPKLRNTTFVNQHGETVEQLMQRSDGVQKGLTTILIERGLWPQAVAAAKEREIRTGKRPIGRVLRSCAECASHATDLAKPEGVYCCATGLLASQPDFMAPVKSSLEELINSMGHLCIFLPKYHCELNFIEMVWVRAKQDQRNECLTTTVGQEANVRRWLEMVTLDEMRKYEARCARFMEFYRMGCSVHLALYAARNKYNRGHRMAPEGVTLAKIEAEYRAWKAKYLLAAC